MKKIRRLTALILFAVFLYVIFHLGQAGELLSNIKKINPLWFGVALGSEILTYITLAVIWWLVLRGGKNVVPFGSLITLSISKTFIDNTIPTGGMTGAVGVTNFFLARGVPRHEAVGSIVVQVISKYIAYFLAFVVAIGFLWWRRSLSGALVYLAIGFSILIIIILAIVFYVWTKGVRGQLPEFIKKFKRLYPFLDSIRHLPSDLLSRRKIILPAIFFQVLIFILHAVTLWAIINGLDNDFTITNAFATHVISSAVATISFVPAGLGVLEGGLVGMLHLFGFPVGFALVVTLIYRGFTFWLPLVPGSILTHKEARRAQNISNSTM